MAEREFDWPEDLHHESFFDSYCEDFYQTCTLHLLEREGMWWSWRGLEWLGSWTLQNGDVLRQAYAALRAYEMRKIAADGGAE